MKFQSLILLSLVLSGCWGPPVGNIPEACDEYFYAGKLEVEYFYTMGVLSFFSDSGRKFHVHANNFLIEPIMEDKQNLAFRIRISCTSPPGDIDESYLAFEFEEGKERLHIRPDSISQISQIWFHAIIRESSHQEDFELLAEREPSQISLHLHDTLTMYAHNDLNYFTTVLSCLNKRGLRKWLKAY